MSGLFLFLLISSASFDIERGPLLELKLGGTFLDEVDDLGVSTGARLSYLFSNPADAFFTLELEGTYDRIFDTDTKSRWLGGMNFAFYETYSPFAFRFAAGGLFERRNREFSPGFQYRFGLGYYWSPRFGAFIDYSVRSISRDEMSFTNELSASAQWIF